MEKKVKIHTRAVHAGDRKKTGRHIPVTTPIYTASSFFYDDMAELDRVVARERPGLVDSRYEERATAAQGEGGRPPAHGAGARPRRGGRSAGLPGRRRRAGVGVLRPS